MSTTYVLVEDYAPTLKNVSVTADGEDILYANIDTKQKTIQLVMPAGYRLAVEPETIDEFLGEDGRKSIEALGKALHLGANGAAYVCYASKPDAPRKIRGE